MTRDQIRQQIRDLLGEHVDLPEDDAQPLQLESFAIVVLAEDLEPRFGIRVQAREVVPAHFGSVARLVDFVAQKLG